MRWFNNIGVLPKFLVTSLLICAIMSAAGWVGLTSVQSIASLSEQSYQNNTLQLELLQDAKTKGLILGSLARTHIIATDQKLQTTYSDGIKTYEKDFGAILDKMESMKQSNDAKATIQGIRSSFAEYEKSLEQVVQLSASGKKTEAFALLAGKDVSAQSNAFFGGLQTLVDAGKEGTRLANETGKNTASTTVLVVLAIVCGGILVSVAISLLAARTLAKPMRVIVTAASLLAQGNLCRDLDEKGKDAIRGRKDELGKVGVSFDLLVEYMQEMSEAATRIGEGDLSTTVSPRSDKDELGVALHEMVTRIGESIADVSLGAEQVSASSDGFARSAEQSGQATSQIADTIQQVAKGAGEQTRAVTDSAAIVSQMSSGIEHVAANSRLVATASTEAAEAARNGAVTVDQSIQAMQRIRESIAPAADKVRELGVRSTEIGNIVEVIDDIAEQTNLLALNAAIEAARAGEHGKGFAVVADEVRKLAERSSKATKEIASLIATVQNGTNEAVRAMDLGAGEVDKGAKLAAEAGHSLEEILKATSRVNEQVLSISSAAQEMMESSTSVVKAIDNISSISEENAAAAEEVSAATEEMTAQVEETTRSADELAKLAGDLQSVVGRFRLAQDSASGSVTPLRVVDPRQAMSGRSVRKSA